MKCGFHYNRRDELDFLRVEFSNLSFKVQICTCFSIGNKCFLVTFFTFFSNETNILGYVLVKLTGSLNHPFHHSRNRISINSFVSKHQSIEYKKSVSGLWGWPTRIIFSEGLRIYKRNLWCFEGLWTRVILIRTLLVLL